MVDHIYKFTNKEVVEYELHWWNISRDSEHSPDSIFTGKGSGCIYMDGDHKGYLWGSSPLQLTQSSDPGL